MLWLVNLFFTTTLLTVVLSHVDNIVCGRTGCVDQTINCDSDKPCNVTCAGEFACYNTEINCPVGWKCTVHCDGKKSCSSSTINGPTSCGAIFELYVGYNQTTTTQTDAISDTTIKIIYTDIANIYIKNEFSGSQASDNISYVFIYIICI